MPILWLYYGNVVECDRKNDRFSLQRLKILNGSTLQRYYVNQLLTIVAISGALFLIIGTFLHPMEADLNVPLAAFTEYAAERNWVASHLM